MRTPDNTVVTFDEATARRVERKDWVACGEAFLDCRIPGSTGKINYALVGMGVAQNAEQVINIQGKHGFDLGAASMPREIGRAHV